MENGSLEARGGESLALARALVRHLEAGERDSATRVLRTLALGHDAELREQFSAAVAALRHALGAVEQGVRVEGLGAGGAPRLDQVVAQVEQAAQRSVDAVEEVLPVAERLVAEAETVMFEWLRVKRGDVSLGEFKHLSCRLEQFLLTLRDGGGLLEQRLTEVLRAQSYHLLGSELLGRIVAVMQELDHRLVGLERITSQQGARAEDAAHARGQ